MSRLWGIQWKVFWVRAHCRIAQFSVFSHKMLVSQARRGLFEVFKSLESLSLLALTDRNLWRSSSWIASLANSHLGDIIGNFVIHIHHLKRNIDVFIKNMLYAAGAAGAGGVPNQMCIIGHVWKMRQNCQNLPIFKKIISQLFYHLFEICKSLKPSSDHEENYKIIKFLGACARANAV